MDWMFMTEAGEVRVWWPPTCTEASFKKAVRHATAPDETTWTWHDATFKLEDCSYETAMTKLSKAQYTSDIGSDVDRGKGKRVAKARRLYESESEDEDSGQISETDIVACPSHVMPNRTAPSFRNSEPRNTELPVVPRTPAMITPRTPESEVFAGPSHAISNRTPGTASLFRNSEPRNTEFPVVPRTPAMVTPRTPVATLPQQTQPQRSAAEPFEEFQKKMLTLMERNYAETRRNSALLQAFLAQQQQKEREFLVESNQFPEIPVTSLAELEGLNNSLSTDKELFKRMAVHLSIHAGCRTLDKTAENVLGSVLGHELATKLNWMGTKQKSSIKPYEHVHDLIVSAVKKNSFTSAVTKEEVLSRLKVWLRIAADRNGGRAKRAIASAAKAAEKAAEEDAAKAAEEAAEWD